MRIQKHHKFFYVETHDFLIFCKWLLWELEVFIKFKRQRVMILLAFVNSLEDVSIWKQTIFEKCTTMHNALVTFKKVQLTILLTFEIC